MALLTFAAPGERCRGRGRNGTEKSLARRSRNAPERRTQHCRRLACERLEERTLLATPGVDYVLTGYSWPNPSHITYSIAPDGVFWDHGTNVLNSTFNAKFGTSGIWEAEIARAGNLGIRGEHQHRSGCRWTLRREYAWTGQGDPRFGDIRIGGYPYVNNPTTLSLTYFPPPQGSTAAGDVEINTAMPYAIGSDYDFYSVILHEFGHAFGLDAPSNPAEVMYLNYQAIRTGLAPGDVAGIQAIYGARPFDQFQAQGRGVGFGSPIDVTSSLALSDQVTLPNLSLQSIGDSEYFSFVAPSYASGSVQISAIATQISMLSPKVSLYDGNGNLLGQASNPSAWSDTVNVTAPSVVPGQRYYVVVSGATGGVFDAGNYDLSVTLPTPRTVASPPAPTPTIPAPSPAPIGVPPDRFEPNNTLATATPLGRVTQITVSGLVHSRQRIGLLPISDRLDRRLRHQRGGNDHPGVVPQGQVSGNRRQPVEPSEGARWNLADREDLIGKYLSVSQLQHLDQPGPATEGQSPSAGSYWQKAEDRSPPSLELARPAAVTNSSRGDDLTEHPYRPRQSEATRQNSRGGTSAAASRTKTRLNRTA